MELREFAERVLFATSLQEKLDSPGTLTDEAPAPALALPEAPGRPPELRFKPSGTGKTDFPGLHRLEREQERGRLLHFFANHELLATELMALALLRFPEAPPAFRRGVLQTLKEEQMHTRLYLERMRQCGIHFGEMPVSGYFWRCVATMASPLDYVARLSLTFEQANLDFCLAFAQSFRTVGDSETAGLLDRIYRDEIGHVAYGLTWFRRWKDPEQSDWEAFCRQLPFPLSPQRAKGLVLNVEGRRAAGFDAGFIERLSVYAQSRGRTPAVFLFNALAEGYIARGRAFTPRQHQLRLLADLQNLPQFLCRQDDIVLVEQKPTVEFLASIKLAGFALPEFVEWPGLHTPSWDSTRLAQSKGGSCLSGRKLGRFRPWAWGPDSKALLQPWFASLTGEKRTPDECFNPAIAELYSKAWSAALLGRCLASGQGQGQGRSESFTHSDVFAPWLCSEEEVGLPVDTVEAALRLIHLIREKGYSKIVVKQAFGLAGQNLLRLWEPDLLESQQRWISQALQAGQQLIIEPWLERECDFSLQLEMEAGGLKLLGFTGLINDRRGQFQANWVAPNFARRLPSPVLSFFPQPALAARLHVLYADIVRLLEGELKKAGYLGPVGIDAFAYRTSQGNCRLKPIVEINPRYTMGRLTLELMRQTCPGSYGFLQLVSRASTRRAGFESLVAYANCLKERFPLRLEGDPRARIRTGALCLNDPGNAATCLATFRVGRSFAEIRSWIRDLGGMTRSEKCELPTRPLIAGLGKER